MYLIHCSKLQYIYDSSISVSADYAMCRSHALNFPMSLQLYFFRAFSLCITLIIGFVDQYNLIIDETFQISSFNIGFHN